MLTVFVYINCRTTIYLRHLASIRSMWNSSAGTPIICAATTAARPPKKLLLLMPLRFASAPSRQHLNRAATFRRPQCACELHSRSTLSKAASPAAAVGDRLNVVVVVVVFAVVVSSAPCPSCRYGRTASTAAAMCARSSAAGDGRHGWHTKRGDSGSRQQTMVHATVAATMTMQVRWGARSSQRAAREWNEMKCDLERAVGVLRCCMLQHPTFMSALAAVM